MNVTQEEINKYGYGTLLFVLQKTVGEDFKYEFREEYSNKKSYFYNSKDKKIAYQNKKKI